jgi:predicted MFS family arabinose efflux permease
LTAVGSAASVAAPAVPARETEAGSRSRLLVLALTLGAFVGMADATLVAVSLDPMSRHFGVPLSTAQEVLGLYLVVSTATLPTLGRAGDRFGRRRLYLGGFGIFAAGSVAGALAPTFGLLLAGRALQAVGGGLLTAGSLALVAEHLPRRRTGRSVAWIVVTQAVAGLIAPPLGGLLTWLWGWQAVFWAGVPVAVAGLLLGLRVIPSTTTRSRVSLDIPGAMLTATLLLGLGAGFGALGGPGLGGLPAAAWLSVAWIALLLLVPAELIASRPILDGRLLRRPRFSGAALATFLSTGTLMSCFALLPFWLENGHGWTPLLAGLAFLPIGIGVGATSRVGGALGDSGRTRVATALGMAVAALGFLVAATAAQTASVPVLLVALLAIGCGNGLFSSPNTAAAISLASRSALGGAAGLLSTARNAGVVTGLGITGAVYTATTPPAAARSIFAAAALLCIVAGLIALRVYRGEPAATLS